MDCLETLMVLNRMTWAEKRRIMDRYDHFVDSYNELHGKEQMAKYAVALENIELRRGEVVADFGCGTGIFLKLVSGFVKKAVGIDLSMEELRRAKDEHSENVHLIQSDIDHPPFRYKTFDRIFSFTVLHHTENMIREVDHLSRYSKKSIVFSVLKRTDVEDEVTNLMETRERVRQIDVHSTKDILIGIETESRS